MAPASDERFAVLHAARRVWAVAALHGEAGRLENLHRALWARFQPGDRLVYLGNYLGYGPDIPGTLDELLNFRRSLLARPGMEAWDIAYLRGVQEEMWHKLLQVQFATDSRQVFDWMMAQGVDATLAAYGGNQETARARFREGVLATTRWTGELRVAMQHHAGHDDLLHVLRRAAYTSGGELLFVHAGVDPSRPLSEQSDTFWWGSGYFGAISQPFEGFRRVVRGFDRNHGAPEEGPYTASIDGGAGRGGPLIAACYTLEGARADRIES